ncbi:hypothetical protein [Streptomyces sp. NBC_00448]|uniref:hypothetical protein n=1 Tax=Streptomyces sp. NBC_00448 TaxID=2903652 RepID=UPI002E229BAB
MTGIWVGLWWAADLGVMAWLMIRWAVRGQRARRKFMVEYPEKYAAMNRKEQSWAGPESSRYMLWMALAFTAAVVLVGPIGNMAILGRL